jgi:hypothetical protein
VDVLPDTMVVLLVARPTTAALGKALDGGRVNHGGLL